MRKSLGMLSVPLVSKYFPMIQTLNWKPSQALAQRIASLEHRKKTRYTTVDTKTNYLCFIFHLQSIQILNRFY